jgi:hypothetical protein
MTARPMAIMSRFVLPQQGRREQSQKQQDDYDQQNFATFVITVSHRTSYTRVNDDYGSPSWRNSGTSSAEP